MIIVGTESYTLNVFKIFVVALAIGFVTLLPHSGLIPLPFAYVLPIILFIWLYLRQSGESFSDIGFSIDSFSFKSVVVGIVVGILMFAFSQMILFPTLEYLIAFDNVEVELYNKLEGNTGFYIFILIMSWLVGGVYEEIVFHGFIFTRLEKMSGGRSATIVSFGITAAIFGLYHLQLGPADALNALVVGAVYHGLFLHFKRNLWYSIFCHCAYNSLAITFLYLGYLQ